MKNWPFKNGYRWDFIFSNTSISRVQVSLEVFSVVNTIKFKLKEISWPSSLTEHPAASWLSSKRIKVIPSTTEVERWACHSSTTAFTSVKLHSEERRTSELVDSQKIFKAYLSGSLLASVHLVCFSAAYLHFTTLVWTADV